MNGGMELKASEKMSKNLPSISPIPTAHNNKKIECFRKTEEYVDRAKVGER